MPDKPIEFRVQAALGQVAYELLAIQERLKRLNERLPVPANQVAMLEGSISPDLSTELSGCIECVVEEHLPRTIDMLQHAACVTSADLERDFQDQQRRRRAEAL
jgi:hypothetical protein